MQSEHMGRTIDRNICYMKSGELIYINTNSRGKFANIDAKDFFFQNNITFIMILISQYEFNE